MVVNHGKNLDDLMSCIKKIDGKTTICPLVNNKQSVILEASYRQGTLNSWIVKAPRKNRPLPTYAEKQSELSYEQQEYADAVLENDFDRLEKEFDMDDRWQKIINDRNANFIPDDLEDPESLDSFKD